MDTLIVAVAVLWSWLLPGITLVFGVIGVISAISLLAGFVAWLKD